MLGRAVCTAAVPVLTNFAIVGFPVDAMERDGIRLFLRLSSLVRKVLMHVFLKAFAFIQYQQFCYSLLISSVALFLLICTLNTLNVNVLKDLQNLPTAQKAVYKEFLMELKDCCFFLLLR